MKLEGILPPIPTPFASDESVAHEQLARNLEKWNKTSLAGYIVMGSNGENVHLSEKEKEEVLATARQAIPSDKLLIAGTGCASTRETIALTEKAAKLGADAAIVVNPGYYRNQMTMTALAHHYLRLAERAPIPIIIYNLPSATGLDLTAELVAELSPHPNIIGIKDTSGNLPKMGDMVRTVDPGFVVLAGSASFFYPALAIGVRGGILALANVAPQQCLEMYRLFQQGEIDRGRELHLRLLPVNQAITARWGVGALKAALDMLGYYGGVPRSPLLPPNEEQKRELRAILERGGLSGNGE